MSLEQLAARNDEPPASVDGGRLEAVGEDGIVLQAAERACSTGP
jgi:hypothetical protein